MGLIVVAPSAALTSMGMDKSGDLAVAKDTTTALKVSGWTARTGYPDTVISAANEILIAGSGAGIARCKVTLSAAWSPSAGAFHVSLMQNNAEIKGMDFPSGQSVATLSDTPIVVQPGDRLWLAVTNSTTGIFGVTATVKGGNGTYVTFDVT
ncbi:hypothetical protein JMUB6875_23700 [Nocardia sp. JMUB6875]|uniref:hypothetical protein n=1 Tax=Nocardia sp. JMUB6875 TaxID=3158170 RepID=UPI0032E6D1AC